MWPIQAACGKPVMSSLASLVECICVPLGFGIVMGLLEICLLCMGVLTVKKYAMHPVSAMAMVVVWAEELAVGNLECDCKCD